MPHREILVREWLHKSITTAIISEVVEDFEFAVIWETNINCAIYLLHNICPTTKASTNNSQAVSNYFIV